MELLLTPKEVAKRLGVSTSTVYRMINERELEFVIISADRRKVPEAALERYIEEWRVRADWEIEREQLIQMAVDSID